MNNVLKIIFKKLCENWHVPAGILIIFASLWVGFMFIHFCPGWMEWPAALTMIGAIIGGIVLACIDVDWTRQY
jgi:uncharacterized integral membrane protein